MAHSPGTLLDGMSIALAEREDDHSYLFDRRRTERTAWRGFGMATFADADGQTALFRVETIDASRAGMGILSPKAVPPGTMLAFFPDDVLAPSVRARVARCEERNGEYVIGIERAACRRVA